ncbi:hypothetical protein ASF41_08590 [Methylobacterium sp. Leaf111]|uniref:hypothetical protein n=1 Tax=Methylobacterium sp. Leaf111 TaxID=1736257 RepID=UPI0006F4E0A6|nr:hypothetical protein [Methylobacterium sp. Leaf111]KQP59780.1 hypothetical protein ASF41_08590 [Methylobacterium sp. Leaf111]
MPPTWRPMQTAPQIVNRIWLNHLTLGPILAEGLPGRWYSPSATRQVWRWYRPAEPNALEPFSGWLPYDALAANGIDGTTTMDDPKDRFAMSSHFAGQQDKPASLRV